MNKIFERTFPFYLSLIHQREIFQVGILGGEIMSREHIYSINIFRFEEELKNGQ